MAPLELREHREGVMAVLDLHGDFDLAADPAFGSRIEQLIEANVREIILDLSGVAFLDSSGLRAMIAALQVLNGLGGGLYVRNAHGQVAEILNLTGAIEAFAMPLGVRAHWAVSRLTQWLTAWRRLEA